MKYTIQNLDEITDSKELLNSRPHPFSLILIYLVIALLLAALTWAYFSNKEIVVKASGIVKPKKDVINISNKAEGAINSLNFKDGDTVKEGQILYTIDHSSLDSQKTSVEAMVKSQTNELNNLTKLKQSIEQGKNLFDASLDTEKDYYNKYKKYIQDSNNLSNQAALSQSQIQGLSDNISNYNLLQKSINDNTNYFGENSSFYNQYMDYQINVSQYQNKINQTQGYLDYLNKTDNVPKDEINSATQDLTNCKQDLEKYKNQYIANIKSNIEQNQDKIRQLQNNSSTSQDGSSKYANKDQYKLDTIIQIDDTIKSTKSKLDETNLSLVNLNNSINDCIVKAENEGVINCQAQLHKGDTIQKGVQIGTILPKANSNYSVDVYINNKDIGNIKNGEKINLSLLALPYREYGNIKSQINNISMDSKVNATTGANYYTANTSINKKYLKNHKGEKAEIKPGMICQVQIVSRKEKMLDYILEKLDLKN